jgi:quercetin dioxygenase-like cupin family protein
MMRRLLIAAVVAGLSLAAACAPAGPVAGKNSTLADVTIQTLAQGPVKTLPAGKVFTSVLEFRQLPGADFGPHAHIASIVYELHGVSTISFPGTAARAVGPGEAAFIPALALHTHQNLDGRIGAGAIAAGLIVVVILLCAATWLRGGLRRAIIVALSLVLIVGGVLPVIGATSNDYYLIAVRPESQRSLPMPRPDGRVAYLSPDLNSVPTAPYVESLSAITVPPGGRYDAPDVPGPETIMVTDGTATVNVGGQNQQLGSGGAAFAQLGMTLAIANPGSNTLKVLDFAVTSAVPAPI